MTEDYGMTRMTQQDLFDEANGIRHFHTIDSDALFDMQLARRRYVVEGLLPEGLTLLTGDPKIGKSFFALSLSVSVAKGVPFLCFPTQKCGVLYFCFEDDAKRLQQRLFEMSEEAFSGLHFCQEILRLGEGFIATLSSYLTEHPDTRLVVVDTLNYIRPDKFTTNMYKSDYDDMILLHQLTQKFSIALLLVHHHRKALGKDDLHAVSGSTGLTGGVDNCISIERPRRSEKSAVLKVVSRDMESFEMPITQNGDGVWESADSTLRTAREISDAVKAVYLFAALPHCGEEPVTVSPTELSRQLRDRFGVDVAPNMITKQLTADHEDLESFGIRFENKRKKSGRYLVFYKTETFLSPEERSDTDELFGSLLHRERDDGSGGLTADLAVESAVNLSSPSLSEADKLRLRLLRCTGDG